MSSPTRQQAVGRTQSRPVGGWGRLVVPAVLFGIAAFAVPMFAMLSLSVLDPEPGLSNFAELSEPGVARLWWRTITFSAVATTITLVLGFPLAYAITKAGPTFRAFLIVGVLSPYLTSVLVRTFSWQVLLGREGIVAKVLNAIGFDNEGLLWTPFAVVIGLVHILLPLAVLPLVAVMSGIDRRLLRSARSLGAGPAQSFVRVFLPQTVSGAEVGTILAFVYAIGSFVTPAILGGQDGSMVGVLIQNRITRLIQWGPGAALAVSLCLAVVVILVIFRRSMAGSSSWMTARSGQTDVRPRTRRRRFSPGSLLSRAATSMAMLLDRLPVTTWAPVYNSFAVLVCIFLVAPQLISIPISFSGTRTLVFPPNGFSVQWYQSFLTETWTQPLLLSVVIAAGSALLATVLGTLAAVGAERGLRARQRSLISGVLAAPLVIPSVVAATAYYLGFARVGLNDTVAGLLIAHTALVLPYPYLIVAANVRSLDPVFERAAMSLGASTLTVARKITARLVLPSVLVGFVFSLLTSFDESVVSVFITGIDTKTLPRQMFDAIRQQTDPTIGVVGAGSILLSVLALIVASWWGRRARLSGRPSQNWSI